MTRLLDVDGHLLDPGNQVYVVKGIAQVKAAITSEWLGHASAIELVTGFTLDDAVHPFTGGSVVLKRRSCQAAKFIQQQLIEPLEATQ